MVRAYVVHEVAQAAEGEDEKVNLLDEHPLARLVLHLEVFAELGRRHHEVAAGWRCTRSGTCVLAHFKPAWWWCVYLSIYVPVESGLSLCCE